MATSYTSLLGLALPVTGELSGTWGDTVNNAITSLLDTAVAGTTTLSTDADVTLTTTTGASNQARQAILLCSGARTAQRTITAPAQSKLYTIINNTTGGFAVKIVGAGPTTGITVAAGETAQVAWNGSDFVKASNQGGAGVFSSVTDSGLTSGRVTYATTGGLLTDSANLTFNGSFLTVTGDIGTAAGGLLYSYNSDNTNNVYVSNPGATGSTNGQMAWTIANVGEAMRLTSAGLGVGVTPSAWEGGSNIDLLNYITLSGWDGSIGANYYYNAGYKYKIGGQGAGSYNMTGGLHRWYNAPTGGSAGAALTFTQRMVLDGSGNLGLGTTNPAALGKFVVAGSTGSTYVNGAGTGLLFSYGGANYIGTTTAGGSLLFLVDASTTAATLSSTGNLGLGVTPSGANITTLQGTSTFNVTTQGDGGLYLTSNAYSLATWKYAATSTNSAALYQQYQGAHTWQTAGAPASHTAGSDITFTTQMVLTAGGNLGLGVTPSAWFTGWKALELQGGSVLSPNTSYLIEAQNAYYDGSWRYKNSSIGAAQYSINSGTHTWTIAPSGTAGAAITFTQAMTLFASGGLSVGNTTDTGSGTVNAGSYYSAGVQLMTSDGSSNYLKTGAALYIQSGSTTRATIDASGNFIMATGSIQEHKSAIAASAIDMSTGNYFSKTISGTTTFTVSNVPSSGTAMSFILDLTNGGSATVNWWTGVKWAGGTAPTLTTSGRDVLGFFTYDGGTTWTGLVLGKDVK